MWLTAWYTATSFLLLIIVTGILYWALKAELNRDGDLFFTDKVNVLQTILRDQPNDRDALREEVELESAARTYDHFYIRLFDGDGGVVIATPGMNRNLKGASFPAASPGASFHGVSVTNVGGVPFRVLTTKLRVGRSATSWTVQIALDRMQQQDLLRRYRRWLWWIWATALVFCPMLGYRIALRGTRPLQRIGATARNISSRTLNERIDAAGYPVELAAVANAFNSMLDRLEESFDRLSQFSADLAHELRTPVNNIRGEAEVALARARSVDDYRDVLGSCLEEAARLSQLISDLLFLARSDNPGEHIDIQTIAVSTMLSTVRDYFDVNATEQNIALIVDCEPSCEANVDRQLMQRAIGNLVANALAHTPPGGAITVRGFRDTGAQYIQVQDTGTGIPADDLPRIFDRFFRVDRARSPFSGGTGLGLAIVKGIVTLHGGTVAIDSARDCGTTVTIRLPGKVASAARTLTGAIQMSARK